MHYRIYYFIMPLIMFTLTNACSRNDQKIRDEFRWISGKWTGEAEGVLIVEQWKWNKFRFEGEGFNIKDGDTLMHEKLFIEDFGGVAAYTVVVNGRGPYSFGLRNTEGQTSTFINEDHDFPAEISYERMADTALHIRLRGNHEAEDAAMEYRLRRVLR